MASLDEEHLNLKSIYESLVRVVGQKKKIERNGKRHDGYAQASRPPEILPWAAGETTSLTGYASTIADIIYSRGVERFAPFLKAPMQLKPDSLEFDKPFYITHFKEGENGNTVFHQALAQTLDDMLQGFPKKYKRARAKIDTDQVSGSCGPMHRPVFQNQVVQDGVEILKLVGNSTPTLTVTDNWNFQVNCDTLPMAGVPCVLTVAKGFATITVVSMEVIARERYSLDTVDQWLSLAENAEKLVTFGLMEGSSLWIPFGHFPVVLGISDEGQNRSGEPLKYYEDLAFITQYLFTASFSKSARQIAEVRAYLARSSARPMTMWNKQVNVAGLQEWRVGNLGNEVQNASSGGRREGMVRGGGGGRAVTGQSGLLENSWDRERKGGRRARVDLRPE